MKKGYFIDGDVIKKLRKENKWTQKELGTSVMKKKGQKGISFRTIQRIETESGYGCSKNVINSLAKVFGVDIKDLLLPTANIESPKNNDISNERHFNDREGIPNWEETLIALVKKYDSWEFELEENQIRYLENEHWGETNFGNLRKFKFQPMTFQKLIDNSDGLIKKEHHESFCKACFLFYSNSDEIPKIECKQFATLVSDADFFVSKLETANEYSIGYDVPEDDHTLNKMARIVEMIENYFDTKLSLTMELRFKYELSQLLKGLEGTSFRLLVQEYKVHDEGSPDDESWVIFRSSRVRILLKSIENKDFVSKSTYCEREKYIQFKFIPSNINPPFRSEEPY